MENTSNSQSGDEVRPVAHAYSPFWALVVLVITLSFLQTAYLIDDFADRARIQTARSELKPVFARAQTINQTTEAVGRELIVLSSKSPEAAKIVAEFNLEINNPAPATE